MERVVGAILRRGAQFLLGHRHPDRLTFPDVWDVPGGRIEEGESAERAIERELREELGIDVDPDQLVPWRTVEDQGYAMTVFVIDHWDGEITIADVTEHDELGWFHVDDLPTHSLARRAHPFINQSHHPARDNLSGCHTARP